MSSVIQRRGRNRLSTISIVLSTGLLMALLTAGLLACASHQGNQPSSASTPSSNQGNPLSSPSALSTQAQECGKVRTAPNGALLDAAAAKQATNCFWQAFQQCHTASLIFTSSGADTVTIRTFTIENKRDGCSISDTVQDMMGPNPASAAKTYTCRGLGRQSDGLHFTSCGEDGDVFVPIAVTQ
jgi:hypothetical protein